MPEYGIECARHTALLGNDSQRGVSARRLFEDRGEGGTTTIRQRQIAVRLTDGEYGGRGTYRTGRRSHPDRKRHRRCRLPSVDAIERDARRDLVVERNANRICRVGRRDHVEVEDGSPGCGDWCGSIAAGDGAGADKSEEGARAMDHCSTPGIGDAGAQAGLPSRMARSSVLGIAQSVAPISVPGD